jgi:hypothetical protein
MRARAREARRAWPAAATRRRGRAGAPGANAVPVGAGGRVAVEVEVDKIRRARAAAGRISSGGVGGLGGAGRGLCLRRWSRALLVPAPWAALRRGLRPPPQWASAGGRARAVGEARLCSWNACDGSGSDAPGTREAALAATDAAPPGGPPPPSSPSSPSMPRPRPPNVQPKCRSPAAKCASSLVARTSRRRSSGKPLRLAAAAATSGPNASKRATAAARRAARAAAAGCPFTREPVETTARSASTITSSELAAACRPIVPLELGHPGSDG